MAVGVAARLRPASLLLVMVAALHAPHQVSCGGQCFRLDGLRLLANLAEALRISGGGGGGGGRGGGGSALGLRLWLHVSPEAVLAPPVPQALDEDLPEARVGRTRITFNPYRNVLEVEEFPSDLEVGFRDGSPMNIAVDSAKSVPTKEVPIERNIILRDLQLMEDTNHLPGHVVLSVNPWSPQAAAVLPQLAVVMRTRSGLSCEVELPASVDAARRLLGHISQLEARHAIAEVVVINAGLLQGTLMKCETLILAESPPTLPFFISPAAVVAAWRVDAGGLRLGPALLPPPPPPPPAAAAPPPVQLRACLPHPALQAPAVPPYWRKVFAIVSEAMSHRLTVSKQSPNESAEDNPRDQETPTRSAPAVPSPSLFHRRVRRSYITIHGNAYMNDSTVNNVWQLPSSQSGSKTEPRETGQVHNNYKLPPPSFIIVNNRQVEVPELPPSWPFQRRALHVPRYVWKRNTWEELSNKNGNSKTLTPRRSLNPASHMRRPLYVFINDIWLLLTSVDILLDKKTNTLHPPKKLLQYQPSSTPTYVWIKRKWVQTVYIKKQWILASSGNAKVPPGSQNKEQIVFAWDTINWVLCKSSNLFPGNNRPTQDTQKPGGQNSGSTRPSNVSHNEGLNWTSGNGGDQTGKHPFPPKCTSHKQEETPTGHPKIQLPLPFGTYKEGGTPPGCPTSGNNRPSHGSHNQGVNWPVGKEGYQTGKHPFPPLYGSHKQKETPTAHPQQQLPLHFGAYKEGGTPPGDPNYGNSCPCQGLHNDRSKSPPENGEKGRGN